MELSRRQMLFLGNKSNRELDAGPRLADISFVSEYYGLGEHVFSAPRHKVGFEFTKILKDASKSKYRFEGDPDILLRLLCVADSQALGKTSEVLQLRAIFRESFTDLDDEAAMYYDLSSPVESVEEIPDPKSLWDERLQRDIRLNEDEYLSKNLTDLANDLGYEPLAVVRARLGLDTELRRPVHVTVLSCSSDAMQAKYGGVAFAKNVEGFGLIALPQDYDIGMLEHEFAHTQSSSINQGSKRYLLRGLNEAITESLTSDPSSYLKQREIADILFERVPSLEQLLLQAYLGDSSALLNSQSLLINTFGLRGYLMLSALTPDNNAKNIEKFYGQQGLHIFVPSETVKRAVIGRSNPQLGNLIPSSADLAMMFGHH